MTPRRVDLIALAAIAGMSLCSACSPRLNIITGTTVGLKASPGDGHTSLPQVTIAYKRSEMALLPTTGSAAVSAPNDPSGKPASSTPSDEPKDAYSALGTFFLSTEFFGDTTLESFISTGHAARNLAEPDSSFQQTFAAATLEVVSDDINSRQVALSAQLSGMKDQTAQQILAQINYPSAGAATVSTLKNVISRTTTDAKLSALETAFKNVTGKQ